MSFPSLTRSYSGIIQDNNSSKDAAKTILKVKKLGQIYQKPPNYFRWERKFDENRKIYYYNDDSNETCWLMPCIQCYKNGDRWCVECKQPYCEKHFLKKHMPLDDEDRTEAETAGLTTHTWSLYEEGFVEPLLASTDDYCIACGLKAATKLCNECWDPYCHSCFALTHRVGALQNHKGLNYKRAKMAWYLQRNEGKVLEDGITPMPEQYVNGANGQISTVKPPELMSDLERVLLQNMKSHRFTIEQQLELIEKLYTEIEKANLANNKTMVDLAKLNQAVKNKKDSKEKDGDDVAMMMNAKEQSAYRQMLMNPSTRRRGLARSNYIKSILEAPFPNTEEAKKGKATASGTKK